MFPVSTLCVGLVASTLALAPITGHVQYRSVEEFDKQIRVTERVLDRTICEDVQRVRSVDKDAYVRMTDGQKRVAAEKAEYEKKRMLQAHTQHCKSSARIAGAGPNAFTECMGLLK